MSILARLRAIRVGFDFLLKFFRFSRTRNLMAASISPEDGRNRPISSPHALFGPFSLVLKFFLTFSHRQQNFGRADPPRPGPRVVFDLQLQRPAPRGIPTWPQMSRSTRPVAPNPSFTPAPPSVETAVVPEMVFFARVRAKEGMVHVFGAVDCIMTYICSA